jgi:uncharacterized membrane protein
LHGNVAVSALNRSEPPEDASFAEDDRADARREVEAAEKARSRSRARTSDGSPPSGDVRRAAAELPARMVRENVEAIVSLENLAESSLNRHQRTIERITAVAGRPGALYATLLLVCGWIVLNVVLEKSAPDPPPFQYLQLGVGGTALFTTLMILITQNRQAKIADQRAHLDLQVNLSTEQKVTKLVEMLDRVQRATTDRSSRLDPSVEALKVSVDPHAVVEALGGIVEEPHE